MQMTTEIYLAGIETQFFNIAHLTNFILLQRTTKELALENYNFSKLIFEDEKLTKYFYVDLGEETKELKLTPELIGLTLPHCTIHSPSLIYFNATGLHTMGGPYPAEFKEPTHNAISPFQYIGKICKADPLFSWLPYDLHICFPIYLHVGPIFFDYNNRLAPSIINIEEVNNEHSNYEPHISKQSIIEFEQAHFSFKASLSFYNEDGNTFGHAGLPSYSQPNVLPKDPKTGDLMQFVCQLSGGVKMKKCDVQVTHDYYKKDLEALNFWGDANLIIYISPNTNTLCCLISH
jgi:hypothetical protein